MQTTLREDSLPKENTGQLRRWLEENKLKYPVGNHLYWLLPSLLAARIGQLKPAENHVCQCQEATMNLPIASEDDSGQPKLSTSDRATLSPDQQTELRLP